MTAGIYFNKDFIEASDPSPIEAYDQGTLTSRIEHGSILRQISLMPFTKFIQNTLMFSVDCAMALKPEPTPAPERLNSCRLVAHRGTHDVSLGPTKENTIQAFDNALKAGAWGIEFDVRWTSDRVPVIHHDRTALRVFRSPLEISKTPFEELRRELPLIPTLDEVISRFQGRMHLMIELKSEEKSLSNEQLDLLNQSLSKSNLEPGRDYHFIGLDPRLLLQCEFVSRDVCFPIAEFNISDISRLALREGFGGMMGHYLLLTKSYVDKHQAQGQKLGTGFPSSRSVLHRELNRGVDWIFTNHTHQLVSFLGAGSR